MFKALNKINHIPELFSIYTAETLWNDPYISSKMLEFHLNEEMEPASRNKKFIDKSAAWIISRFNIQSGFSVCDFGCGPGLYTTEFAKKGAEVTGIDFSHRSIEYAITSAKKQGLVINYINQNYLDFKCNQKFDLITMIYCDFCALSPSQRSDLIQIFQQHLKPGGKILLDVFTMEAYYHRDETIMYEPDLMGGFWSADPYYGFMNTIKYDREKVVLDKYTIVEETETREVYNWLQYFSQESLTEAFNNNGFKVKAVFENVAGDPIKPASNTLAIEAENI